MVAFVGFLLFISVSAAPQGGEMYDAETDCFTQYPSITRDYIENLKHTRTLPEDPTTDFKCFIACVGKKLELMSHVGDLHFDNLKNMTVEITAGHASHDDAHSIVNKCIGVDHDDDCEKAYKYVQCKIEQLMPYKFSKDFCPGCPN